MSKTCAIVGIGQTHHKAKRQDVSIAGLVREARQPHLRGGAREPLSREEILAKFRANTRHGGWTNAQADALASWCQNLFAAPGLDGIASFRI